MGAGPAVKTPGAKEEIVLDSEPLSEEEGTLTRGLKKLVPKAILERYQKEIEEAYQS